MPAHCRVGGGCEGGLAEGGLRAGGQGSDGVVRSARAGGGAKWDGIPDAYFTDEALSQDYPLAKALPGAQTMLYRLIERKLCLKAEFV